VVPTHPMLPHGTAAYLNSVPITVSEQSCLLAQFFQGNPPKLAQSCRDCPHPCRCWLSESKAPSPLLGEPQGRCQHSRETRSKHFLSSVLGFTWQVSKFSLAGGRLSCKQSGEASKGCGPAVTSIACLWKQSHGPAFCPALCLWVCSQKQCEK